MLEKLQLAEEETYKDPANIQSKHQKHQAFEAELGANADRIQSVLAMGQNLVRFSLFIVLFFFSTQNLEYPTNVFQMICPIGTFQL